MVRIYKWLKDILDWYMVKWIYGLTRGQIRWIKNRARRDEHKMKYKKFSDGDYEVSMSIDSIW